MKNGDYTTSWFVRVWREKDLGKGEFLSFVGVVEIVGVEVVVIYRANNSKTCS